MRRWLMLGFVAMAAPCSALAGPQGLSPPEPSAASTDSGRESPPQLSEQSKKLLVALIYEQIVTFNNACQERNFAILHGKASPRFQRDYPMARIRGMFAGCGPEAFDLRAFVGGRVHLDRLYQSPDGIELKMKGDIAEGGLRLSFELQFEEIANRWKMSVMTFDLRKRDGAEGYRPASRRD
jgi:hypothetical protein